MLKTREFYTNYRTFNKTSEIVINNKQLRGCDQLVQQLLSATKSTENSFKKRKFLSNLVDLVEN